MTLTPEATDAQLTAWRDAAAHGGLPSPERSRWQVLRAGCVGLWEFDAAEYWFADGRAQFVGANQSGKSTLMALTTLIMLSGSLEVKWGDQLEQTVTLEPGDMVYVPPRETHLLTNLSDAEAAEYVVARDSPTEDSVEVPWAGE